MTTSFGWEGKDRHGSFRSWMNAWVAGKTVWSLDNACHTWSLLWRGCLIKRRFIKRPLSLPLQKVDSVRKTNDWPWPEIYERLRMRCCQNNFRSDPEVQEVTCHEVAICWPCNWFHRSHGMADRKQIAWATQARRRPYSVVRANWTCASGRCLSMPKIEHFKSRIPKVIDVLHLYMHTLYTVIQKQVAVYIWLSTLANLYRFLRLLIVWIVNRFSNSHAITVKLCAHPTW